MKQQLHQSEHHAPTQCEVATIQRRPAYKHDKLSGKYSKQMTKCDINIYYTVHSIMQSWRRWEGCAHAVSVLLHKKISTTCNTMPCSAHPFIQGGKVIPRSQSLYTTVYMIHQTGKKLPDSHMEGQRTGPFIPKTAHTQDDSYTNREYVPLQA